MHSLKPLLPLLLAAGILLAGNGIQGTLVTLRGIAEGFSPLLIGLMGTAYFAGFMIGCIAAPRMLQAVGHIRSFAALAAIGASACLLLSLWIDPYIWMALRLVAGFAFAALFTTIESWLNAGVANDDRGRVLSLYRIIDLAAVIGGQFLIPEIGIDGFALFIVLALMISLSQVPVSLADRSSPAAPKALAFDLRVVWGLSPIACIGCISIGLTNSAFRLIGPLYAEAIGLDVKAVAIFMSAGILGGAVLQYPLGALSDRYDRRVIILVSTGGAAATGVFISLVAGSSPELNYFGVFCFGAFALPLYSLSAAHANDHARGQDYVLIAAGLTFCFSAGAMVGPFLSSFLVNVFGPRALFAYTTVVHITLIALTLWRLRSRQAVPRNQRDEYVTLLRTSPSFYRLAGKRNDSTPPEHGGS